MAEELAGSPWEAEGSLGLLGPVAQPAPLQSVQGAPALASSGVPEPGEGETTSGYVPLYIALRADTQCSTAGVKLNGSCSAQGLPGLPFVVLFYCLLVL